MRPSFAQEGDAAHGAEEAVAREEIEEDCAQDPIVEVQERDAFVLGPVLEQEFDPPDIVSAIVGGKRGDEPIHDLRQLPVIDVIVVVEFGGVNREQRRSGLAPSGLDGADLPLLALVQHTPELLDRAFELDEVLVDEQSTPLVQVAAILPGTQALPGGSAPLGRSL